MTFGPDGRPYGAEGGVLEQMTEDEERDHVEMLIEKLTSRDPVRRQRAAIAMASYIADQMHLPASFKPHPAAVLASEMAKQKLHKGFLVDGCRALGIMGPHAAPYAADIIGKMVNYPDHEVRWEAMRAARAMGPAACKGCAAALALASVDHDYANAHMRYEAIKSLAVMGPEAAPVAGEALAQALMEKDPDIHNAAAKALVVMGPGAAAAAAPALVTALTSGRFELMRHAADALASMGVPAADVAADEVARKLRPLPGSDERLREKAAKVLGSMGPDVAHRPEQEMRLARALGDPDSRVREAARQTLAGAGCARALGGSMALFEPIQEPPPPLPPPPMGPEASAAAPEAEAGEASAAAGTEEAAVEPEAPAAAEDQEGAPEDGEGGVVPASEPEQASEGSPAAPPSATTDADEARKDQVRVESDLVMERLGIPEQ